MHRMTLAAAALLALALTACSGSGTSTTPTTPATSASASAAPAASSAASPAADSTALTVRDFTFDEKDVSVKGAVSLAVTNAGPTIHNVTIRDDAGTVLGATSDLKSGTSETLTADLPAGTYVLFCSLPGHESLGIKGTLTVTK